MQAKNWGIRKLDGQNQYELEEGILFSEQCFTKLVAPNERFQRAETSEEILNLAILVDALGWTNDRGGNHLQRV